MAVRAAAYTLSIYSPCPSFHACRYPVKPSDTAEKFDLKENNHVVFVRKNKFFEVPLAHADGKWLSTKELESQIQKVYDLAGPSKALPVGALTSDNRDLWADARAELVKSSLSAKTLQRIESAMVVVALDDTKPTSREETSWACWTGDGRNRFYDKHQLIVFDNGRSGFLGEHSCMVRVHLLSSHLLLHVLDGPRAGWHPYASDERIHTRRTCEGQD